MKQTFQIERKPIMDLVSALTADIAKKNDIDADELWASESDYARLDVAYNGAIIDLEKELIKFVNPSARIVPLSDVGDYTLSLTLNDFWPTKYVPLVVNMLQQYFLHRILADWLIGFHTELASTDYKSLWPVDLKSILTTLLKSEFTSLESEHVRDLASMHEDGETGSAMFRQHVADSAPVDTRWDEVKAFERKTTNKDKNIYG